MAILTGKEITISIGDKGVIRLSTYIDLLSATAIKVYIYTQATFAADIVDPVPMATISAVLSSTLPRAPAWKIEAANPGTIFTTEGTYIFRAYAEWADGRKVLGAPVEVFVTRGSGT